MRLKDPGHRARTEKVSDMFTIHYASCSDQPHPGNGIVYPLDIFAWCFVRLILTR